jgi:tetratricopeptide (TPR) repeat protein
MFFFLPPAAGFACLLERYPKRHPVAVSAAVLVVIYLFAQGHTVRMRNELFSHPLLLWRDNVEKAPGLHRPLHNLANEYFAAGRAPEALTLAIKALAARPAATVGQKHITWYNLGLFFLSQGEMKEAEDALHRALDLAPGNAMIFHKLAVANRLAGKLNAAENYGKRALQISGGAPAFLPTLGMVLLHKGDTAGAVQMAVAQLKRPDASPFWYYLLGEAFRHRGELARAANCFETFARANPDHVAVHAALAEIYYLTGNSERQKKAALRLYCQTQTGEVGKVLDQFDLRYNTLDHDRVERIRRAVEGAHGCK